MQLVRIYLLCGCCEWCTDRWPAYIAETQVPLYFKFYFLTNILLSYLEVANDSHFKVSDQSGKLLYTNCESTQHLISQLLQTRKAGILNDWWKIRLVFFTVGFERFEEILKRKHIIGMQIMQLLLICAAKLTEQTSIRALFIDAYHV